MRSLTYSLLMSCSSWIVQTVILAVIPSVYEQELDESMSSE
jgi:hypothetical protein